MKKSTQEQKIESALSELIDQVERFFNVAPLRFLDIDSGNDDIGCFTFRSNTRLQFGRFESWFRYLLETLDPETIDVEQKVNAAEKVIGAVLPDDAKVKLAWGDMCDGVGCLAFPAQHVGFYVGVWSAQNSKVARGTILLKLAKGLMLPCLRRKVAHSNAEYEAKREAETKKNGKGAGRG